MAKNTFYLGTCDRYNNPMYPRIYKAFVTGGAHGPLFWYIGHFETDEEVNQFIYSSSKLKSEVDSMNAEHASKNMTDVEYLHWVENQWIPNCHEFINMWGKELVTKDLRWALNDMEKGVGMNVTLWPVMPEHVAV